MTATILRLAWLNMRRDRVAQALTFLLPILFFSIFASVFGGRNGETSRIRIAVVDEDGSELSRRIVQGLAKEPGLRVRAGTGADGTGALDRASGEGLVREGTLPVTVVIPKGLGESVAASGFTGGDGPRIQLLADVSDPVAPQMVLGLLQKVAMTAAPDLMMQAGMAQFEQHAGALTPQQRAAVDQWLPTLRQQASGGPGAAAAGPLGVGVDVVDVMGSDTRQGEMVSFYAAGIGVMFLLFSMVGAAGGALLDEVEAGTLERVLSTRAGMGGVLFGKWLFLAMLGSLQLLVMFLWGFAVFGLPLFSHFGGFTVMTAVTASAAAALGLVLATVARTRAQLSGFSTILILTMSALGGSMFPRFLMSETMQQFGLLTFNGWALDGYLKVFWYEAPILQLWPQVLVLATLTAVFLSVARLLARRWEVA